MKRVYIALLSIVAFATITGCSKDPLANLTEEESRIYITNHDANANFRTYTTFSIADSVAVINNGQVSKQRTATDVAFINAVRSSMQARGYTMVSKSADPDLAINVNRIINTSQGIISYNNYWDMYNGFWDPFYWGYGGFGYYTPFNYATYTIREGALSIDMLDLKNAPASNQIKVVWTGLIRGSGVFNASTASTQVNMLFEQSPYISVQ